MLGEPALEPDLFSASSFLIAFSLSFKVFSIPCGSSFLLAASKNSLVLDLASGVLTNKLMCLFLAESIFKLFSSLEKGVNFLKPDEVLFLMISFL